MPAGSILNGTSGADTLSGLGNDDTLNGLAGNDSLLGNGGNDLLDGGAGNDSIDGGGGTDTIQFSNAATGVTVNLGAGTVTNDGEGGSDTLTSIENAIGTSFNDSIFGSSGVNSIVGGAGNDTLGGGGGNDTIDGGAGNDVWVASSTAPGGANVDLSAGTALDGQGGTDTLISIESVSGTTHNDTITGDSGSNTITGGGGDDSMVGGGGNDVFVINAATDYDFAGGTVLDTIDGGTGFNSLRFNYNVGAANDSHIDHLSNIQGLILANDVSGQSMTIGLSSQTEGLSKVDASLLTHSVILNAAAYTSAGVTLVGGTANDTITGGAGRDLLQGGGGNDTISSGAGNDTLVGGTGNDTLNGGSGSDTVRFDGADQGANVNLATGVVANDGNGGNNDTLISIENAVGTTFNDTLVGSSANNNFNPGGGNDTITGGLGYDSITLNSLAGATAGVTVALNLTGTTTIAIAGAGTDTVTSIENITGTVFADQLTGNAFGNVLGGDRGNDTLDGSRGSDWASYSNANQGVTIDLSQFATHSSIQVDDGTYLNGTSGPTGTDTLISIERIIGSAFDDSVKGGNESNVFRSGGGQDTFDGGLGNDRIDFSDATSGVSVDLSAGGSITVSNAYGAGSSVTFTGVDQVEGTSFNDVLTGNNSNNYFAGRGGNNTIDGGHGSDQAGFQSGGFGTSTGVIVDLSTGAAFVDVDNGLGGTDRLISIEGIRGSYFDDWVKGGNASNYFQGLGGNDTFDGGEGLDRADYSEAALNGVNIDLSQGTIGNGHVVTVSNDGDGGTDTLASVEEILGTVFADTLTGNVTENYFRGDVGNDSIDGGAGSDFADYSLAGHGLNINLSLFASQSTISVDDGQGGTDTLASIERLVGSNFNDTLIGGAENNIFRGGLGNDSLVGGAGMDIADFRDAQTQGINVNLYSDGTTYVTDGDGGNDTLTGIEGIIGTNFDDTLQGDNANNYFRGGIGDDYISGGNDTTPGHIGNDTVSFLDAEVGISATINSAGTFYVEDGLGGTDTLTHIRSIEGSNFNDSITGDAADNVLRGGVGNDTLDGGGGNDTADFSRAIDRGVSIDLSPGGTILAGDGDGGTDTLISIENLTGTNYADTLIGVATGSVLTGGGGADSLVGGAGNDVFVFNGKGDYDFPNGTTLDTIVGGGGVNAMQFNYNIGTGTDAHINHISGIQTVILAGNDGNSQSLTVGLNAQTEGLRTIDASQLNNAVTVNASAYTADIKIITSQHGDDSLVGGSGNDTFVYDGSVSGGDKTIEGGAGSNIIETPDAINNLHDSDFATIHNIQTLKVNANTGGQHITLGANSQNIMHLGTVDASALTAGHGISVDGSARTVSIDLIGGGGNDTLRGGAGSDTIVFGDGDNSVAGGAGSDLFIFAAHDKGDEAMGGFPGDDTTPGGGVYMGGGDTIDGGAGIDTAQITNALVNEDDFQDATNIEVIKLTDWADQSVTLGTGSQSAGIIEVDASALSAVHGVTLDAGDRWIGIDLIGGAGQDEISGGSGSDTLLGGAGDDSLFGDAGTNVIDGGDGVDTAFYSTNYWANEGHTESNYTVNVDATGVATVTYFNGESSINDTLTHVEFLHFNDATIAIGASGTAGNDVMNGTVGTDLIYGLAGNDYILGQSGNDTIDGGDGNDVVAGNTGNDSLVGNNGDDTVNGGAGDDTATGGAGNDLLAGVWGNDSLDGGTGTDTLYGMDGNDTLQGGAGNDSLDGGAGNDIAVFSDVFAHYTLTQGANGTTIVSHNSSGVDGVDTLANVEFLRFSDGDYILPAFGTTGNDTLSGTTNNDSIGGLAGNDFITGGDGGDTLDGGDGNDIVAGNIGNDFLFGGNGDDTMNGGAGDDTALGGSGNDMMSGVWGNDSLDGGAGSDTLYGMDGNDTLAGGPGNDSIDGGVGNDVVVYTGARIEYSIILGANAAMVSHNFGLDGVDTLANVEKLRFTDQDVSLTLGTSGSDSLTGSSGNDIINGNAGNDQINAGDGSDNVDGGAGNDLIFGDAGSDTLLGGADADTVDGGDGGDSLLGGSGADLLIGGIGDDTVDSGSGADTLVGGDGNDMLTGGSGNDSIDGGAGYDTVSYAGLQGDYTVVTDQNTGITTVTHNSGGTDGVDTLVNVELLQFSNGSTAVPLYGTTGADLLSGSANADIIFGLTGNDVLYGFSGDDSIDGGDGNDIVAGNTGNDTVLGGIGDDTVNGGAGNDSVGGGTGDDLLAGVWGNDTLNGGTGNDTLVGGTGNDVLDGGAGTNVFQFANNSYEGPDVISNWNAGTGNTIRLTDVFGVALTGAELRGAVYDALHSQTASGSDRSIMLDGGTQITVSGLGRDLNAADFGASTGPASTIAGATINNVARTITLHGANLDALRQPGENGGTDIRSRLDFTHLTLDINNDGATTANHTFIASDFTSAVSTGDTLTLTLTSAAATALTAMTGYGITGGEDSIKVTAGLIHDILGNASTTDGNAGSLVNYYLTATGTEANLQGGSGDDTLTGSGGNDFSDILSAGGGNDLLQIGYGGNNTLDGGAGNDTITTGFNYNFNDLLTGGTGNDEITIDYGFRDTLHGGTGDDTLDGGDGNSTLTQMMGDDGNDVIYGGTGGRDTLDGGNGDDALYVDSYGNVATGGDGNDTIIDTYGDESMLDGGAGNDSISSSYEEEGSYGMSLIGGTGNDVLRDDNGYDDTLDGGAGNDTIYANGLDDLVIGGAGNDLLDGSGGSDVWFQMGTNLTSADTIIGSSYDDLLEITGSNGTDDLLHVGGIDTIALDNGKSAHFIATDALVDTESTLTVDASDLSSLYTLNFDGSAETDGQFDLTGGDGSDTLTGGQNGDTIDGGYGTNVLDGGTGSDVAIYHHNHSLYGISTTGGVTTITYSGEDGDIHDTLTNIETLRFADGDLVTPYAVSLLGAGGNDVLTGTDGADTLNGAGGNDLLTGGRSNDVLTGGSGSDTFHIASTFDGTDTITDYAHGSDVLSFTGSGMHASDLGIGFFGEAGSQVQSMFGGTGFRVANHGFTTIDFGTTDTLFDDGGHIFSNGFSGSSLTGTAFDDLLVNFSTAGDVTMDGGDGDDRLSSYDSNLDATDYFNGGAGNDTIESFSAGAEIDGGSGNDVVHYNQTYANYSVSTDSETGITTVYQTYSPESGIQYLSNVEQLEFSDINVFLAADTQEATGLRAGDLLYGGGGDDTLTGVTGAHSGGGDYLEGGAGNDVLNGSTGGNDTFVGGPGADSIFSSGNGSLIQFTGLNDGSQLGDTEFGFGNNDNVFGFQTGSDMFQFDAAIFTDGANHFNPVTVPHDGADLSASRFFVISTATDDLLDQAGVIATIGDLSYDVAGGHAVFVLHDNSGGAGIYAYQDNGNSEGLEAGEISLLALVYGYTPTASDFTVLGSERLNGTSAAEHLSGGTGNDSINGIGGNDTLTGGTGADAFVFTGTNDGIDNITDFSGAGGIGGQHDRILFNGEGFHASDLTLNAAGTDLTQAVTSPYYGAHFSGPGLTTADVIAGDITASDGSEVLVLSQGENTLASGTSQGDLLVSFVDSGVELDGNDGNDRLISYNTNYESTDTLDGGNGNDIITSAGGNDSLGSGNAASTYIDGGDGTNVVTYSMNYSDYNVTNIGEGVFQVSLAGESNWSDQLHNVEIVQFHDGAVWLVDQEGDSGDNYLVGGIGDDGLFGNDGNDTLYGDRGNDYLDGGDGNDVLTGAGGDSTLLGGNGDDSLTGGGGDESLSGGHGDDTINGGMGDDLLDGGHDEDQLNGAGGDDTLYGGYGDDNIEGGDGDDSLNGDPGDDSLYGGIGNDTLEGGGGYDTLEGGIGNDVFVIAFTDSRNETVSIRDFNQGLDTIHFTGVDAQAADYWYNNGSSQLEDGNYTGISFDSYSDRPDETSFNGSEITFADGGHLLSMVNEVEQQLDNGESESNDLLILAGYDASDDTVFGGIGDEHIQDLTYGSNVIHAGAGDDTVIGSGDDTIYGDNGDDSLQGGYGDNLILGGNGDDTIESFAGNDTVTGGNGYDVFKVNYTADVAVMTDFNADDDQIQFTAATGHAHDFTYDAVHHILENFEFGIGVQFGGTSDLLESSSMGNDRITFADGGTLETRHDQSNANVNANSDGSIVFLSGASDNDVVNGGDGRDQIFDYSTGDNSLNGGAGDDTLASAGSGDDSINGGDGNDSITGGSGDDTLVGGADNDSIDGGTGINTVIYDGYTGDYDLTVSQAGSGVQLVLADSRGDSPDGTDTILNVHTVEFADGGEILVGSTGNDLLTGTAGDDTIIGLSGHDTIDGGDGFNAVGFLGNRADFTFSQSGGTVTVTGTGILDTLTNIDLLHFDDGQLWLTPDATGGSDGDELHGGLGNDTITGNGGYDTLTGELGADHFHIASIYDRVDSITDFATDDVLDFSGSGIHAADLSFDETEGTQSLTGYFSEAEAYAGFSFDDTDLSLLTLTAGNSLFDDGSAILINSTSATLDMNGTAGDDLILNFSSHGGISIFANAGDDRIVNYDNGDGINGDYIDGGAGDDTITGGENGGDTIIGGLGADSIEVSGGGNVIRYDALGQGNPQGNSDLDFADSISGFLTGSDRFDFSRAVFATNNHHAEVHQNNVDLNVDGIVHIDDHTTVDLNVLSEVAFAIGNVAHDGGSQNALFVVEDSVNTGIYEYHDNGVADGTVQAGELTLLAVVLGNDHNSSDFHLV